MRKCWILFLSVFITFTHHHARAEVYTIGDQKISLPFEKSWMAKTDNPKSNLLFFDPNLSNPRPVVQVALSAFRYPSDLSAFIERYHREKREWVTKQSGKLMSELKDSTDRKARSIHFELHFSIPIGEFFEWSLYQECAGGSSISLKMMVPHDGQAKMREHWDSLKSSGLCG